ncbi:putative bacteriocin resistance protein [Pseudomonas sp. OF001]|uniref:C39 family peptidase n=1 Tax=unclassified Pseudomonas TaxID=196821 RepID=UPI0010A69A98|nr:MULTISPECIES: C39 family peptidase [unclassified Pseudomonas]THG85709.1 peptidase C39 [Pseudomonas sp. A-1]CAD5376782.1 putative bacteriocin resistance protein [Pseudomonas sp. OF001]
MRLVILPVLCCLSGALQAAQVPMAVLPGGALAFKQVESMREQRFSNLVEQKTDFSCGAAALATILRQAYRFDVDETFVINGMLLGADHELVRNQGFSMLDMKRYIENLGMRARGYRIEADGLERLKIPVVVLQEIRGYKHFVVLQRTQDGFVYIGDPVLGHKRYSLEDFTKGWNGIVFAVIGPEYDRANALLSPPEPLTARKHLDGFQPVQDAELMEHGFIQSDFF